MGYELDKLMRQFGVSSPSMTYGGTQSGTPDFQQDRDAFDQYANKYMDQIGNGAMYAQPQFGQQPRNTPMLAQPAYAASNPATSMPVMPALPPVVTQPNMEVGAVPRPGGAKRDEYGADMNYYADGGLAELAGQYDADPSVVNNPFSNDAPVVNRPSATPSISGQSFDNRRRDDIGPEPSPKNINIMAMLEKYQPSQSGYGEELKKARETASKETDAFNAMLQRAMENQADTAPSKAEMYFRLAAAFGAPTRSGNFGESLGKVGEAMGQYSKETREAARSRAATTLQLGLQGQQARMTGAKEDLSLLRGLDIEDMKDRRAAASKAMDAYIKSGEPQSTAGKQALDEGLMPGTPKFQARVMEVAAQNIEKQNALIQAALAGAVAATGNLGVARDKLSLAKENSKKLSPQELKLKTETESAMNTLNQAYVDLKRAIEINPQTFDASIPDQIQYKALSSFDSKDPKTVNTGELNNLLKGQALSTAATTLKTQISDADIKMLQGLQGIDAKSIEERKKILDRAKQRVYENYKLKKKQLQEIESGKYRNASPQPGDE